MIYGGKLIGAGGGGFFLFVFVVFLRSFFVCFCSLLFVLINKIKIRNLQIKRKQIQKIIRFLT